MINKTLISARVSAVLSSYPQLEDWPTDEETERKMTPVMQNGNCGSHYKGTCPKCQGKNLVKRGMDKGQQRYECKFCLHKFRHQG